MSWVKYLAVIFIIAACKGKESVTENRTSNHDLTSIVWERERCRGNCKEFSMKIISDGSCELRSGVNMRAMGDFKMNLSKQFVDSLFFSISECTKGMLSDYNPNVSDFQQVNLSIQRSDGTSVIKGLHKVPECYTDLSKQLDQLALSELWK